jgi:hypothetical protein
VGTTTAPPAGRGATPLVEIDEHSEEMGRGDHDGSAGGARGNAPRGIDEHSEEMGSGDHDGSAGGARGNAPRGMDRYQTAFV